jgi:hypothetical protein
MSRCGNPIRKGRKETRNRNETQKTSETNEYPNGSGNKEEDGEGTERREETDMNTL